MVKRKKIICIVQARLNSERFKNKILKKVSGKTLIEILLKQLSFSKYIDKVVVAIPKTDKKLFKFLKKKNEVFLGSENDVLSRYYNAAKEYNAEIVVRVTGDCPLIDTNLIDKGIQKFLNSNYDYVSNIDPPTFPDGLDFEVFSFKTLKKTYEESTLNADREHVTSYILKNNEFKRLNIQNTRDLSHIRVTLDYKEDYKVIKKIISFFIRKKNISYEDILKFYYSKKKIFEDNSKFLRNSKNKNLAKGQKLWLEAKKVIAGGNMLFSKRPDAFLPGAWPSYFKSTKGCQVIDLDNKKYFDLCSMSVGTNTLGYSNKFVDSAVKEVVKNGNMSTLNCSEEVHLAKKLIKLHPWADRVRFARTGGEANAIAIRLARASASKKNVAFCGYHGWHDWYLAANIKSKKNLSEHLLKGLEVDGVPKSLKKTIYPFMYNDFKTLKKIVKEKNIGIIKMEVIRYDKPKNNFLKKVRNLADKNNIILIFDECTSGFRQAFGGIHKIYGVNPDILVLGKALGNGYAITSVLGKEEIMDNIKNTFISSTFWTERIGPTAALKTLEVMEKQKSWEKITRIGKTIMAGWAKIAKKNKLKIKVRGIPAFCSFIFLNKNHSVYRTYITQEMLKKGFLATNVIYASIAHDKKILKKYFKELDIIFKKIRKFEDGENIYNHLEGKLATETFGRLN